MNYPRKNNNNPRTTRVLWVLAFILLALVVMFEIYATWSVFDEWDSIQSAEGTGAALSDAFGRIAFGLVINVLILAPALVAWFMRSAVRARHGRVGAAIIFMALAVVVMGGVSVAFVTSLSQPDGQAALLFLWPPVINPVLAVCVGVALGRDTRLDRGEDD